MRRKKGCNAPVRADIEDPHIVLFQGEEVGMKPGAVELQSFGSELKSKLFGRSLQDVKEDFVKVSEQINDILHDAFSKVPEGLTFDTIEIALGFSAEGKLAFIAKAGMKASVTVRFKKA